MVRAINRHLGTTPAFLESFKNVPKFLNDLRLDLLWSSDFKVSKDLSIQVARKFLSNPAFPASLISSMSTDLEFQEKAKMNLDISGIGSNISSLKMPASNIQSVQVSNQNSFVVGQSQESGSFKPNAALLNYKAKISSIHSQPLAVENELDIFPSLLNESELRKLA